MCVTSVMVSLRSCNLFGLITEGTDRHITASWVYRWTRCRKPDLPCGCRVAPRELLRCQPNGRGCCEKRVAPLFLCSRGKAWHMRAPEIDMPQISISRGIGCTDQCPRVIRGSYDAVHYLWRLPDACYFERYWRILLLLHYCCCGFGASIPRA